MQELKFRAWNEADKSYDYADLTPGSELYFDADTIIEQFTGLRDKNEQEIYEGDIFNLLGKAGKIISGPNTVELADFLGGHYWIINNGETPIYEVIGNIHELEET
jgi:hypothetical protein